ncbi:Signal transduction histidine kinase [Dyadobacter sp. SG02]|uniref:sensor histidine kinase n=1 Tax=Dyadobacter sp. SG02 TaxID=1855291 RepID=UPI0008D6E73B|nr:ATP-binding protein [Dyadobacter sp. SG02]SEJ50608.1 Signal transduction histidine kinase [Dyadobacter sp. SG02]
MRLILHILIQLLLVPAALQGIAQVPKYTLRHYTGENGLPQNSVSAITQGHDGFIWLTTYGGLVRFDGQSFVTFNKNKLGLQSGMFVDFLPDADHLYALTNENEYVRVADGRAVKDVPLPVRRIREMFKMKEGYHGLFFSKGHADRLNMNWFLPDQTESFKKIWFPSIYVLIIPESIGSFFVWHKNGTLDSYANWKKTKSYATRVSWPRDIFRIGRSLYNDDRAGNIELLAPESGSNAWPGDAKLTPTRPHDPRLDMTKPYLLYSHDLSKNAFIYQGHKLYMLSEVSPGNIRTRLLLDYFDFQKNNVASVFFDEKHRRLYLGSLSNGLFIFDFQPFETLTIGSDQREANVYYAHSAFSDSTVITPSFNVLGKSAAGQTVAYKLPQPMKEFLMNQRTMLIDESGDIWCVRNNMLYRFDAQGRQLKGQWNAGGEVSHIYEDPTGRIWLGTRFEGLRYIDPSEKGVPVHTFTRKILRITYMLQEGSETLWVGADMGLFKVNLRHKSFSLIPHTDRIFVKNLYIPYKGELWFATRDHGLCLYRNGRLTQFPMDKNRQMTSAHCLILDKNGYFWMPTNNGLFRILRGDLLDYTRSRDSTRLYYHRYIKRDGFRIDEFDGGCQPCAVRLRNGYVSLPSLDGMVFFKPEETPVDIPDSKIFIDRIESNSQDVPFTGTRIKLPVTATDLKVFISSPYLGNRENQQIYYAVSSDRRAETGQVWFPIENEQQSIHLNNLESGTYTLKIRKNAGYGRNAERLTTLTVMIPYKWYETWPFRIVVLLLAAVGFWMYFKNRLKKADRLNKILESRVSEKTHNLQETLTALEASEQELIKQIKLQMHLIGSISHDIRSPLRSIQFTASQIPSLIRTGDYGLAENVGTSVSDSSGRILSLLDNMLSYVKSQVSGGPVTFEEIAVRKLIDDVAAIFKDAFALRHNVFICDVPESLVVKSNPQLLKVILHNLIDNANKFTSAGAITVRSGEEGGMITLSVSDSGSGLPGPVESWFNTGTSYPESPGGGQGMHGIGLVIVKELAELLKLRLQVHSRPGAEFVIGFP